MYTLQNNFNTLPPFLQQVANKFHFEIVEVDGLYFLKDSSNFNKSYLVLMEFQELCLLLEDLAELNNLEVF